MVKFFVNHLYKHLPFGSDLKKNKHKMQTCQSKIFKSWRLWIFLLKKFEDFNFNSEI